MKDRRQIYLDHAATSPLRAEVWKAMEAELEHCFNPASSHAFGRQAHRCLELARGEIAALLGGDRICFHFTGGGTQSDNLAILGFVRAHRDGRRPRVFVSCIEHKACLEAAARASGEADVRRIPVDAEGVIDLAWLDRALAAEDRPTLVSVMWANNEIGTVQPMAEIVSMAHDRGALVHSDAVQALGKVPVRIDETPVDLLSATAHKLGGPVGIGLRHGTPARIGDARVRGRSLARPPRPPRAPRPGRDSGSPDPWIRRSGAPSSTVERRDSGLRPGGRAGIARPGGDRGLRRERVQQRIGIRIESPGRARDRNGSALRDGAIQLRTRDEPG